MWVSHYRHARRNARRARGPDRAQLRSTPRSTWTPQCAVLCWQTKRQIYAHVNLLARRALARANRYHRIHPTTHIVRPGALIVPRQMNFEPISWFWDLRQYDRLEMDPPYQRKSVWSQSYRDYFIDTVLNDYPAPAIFLHKETTPEGMTKYSVIDGKQRLTTVFMFANNLFPTSSNLSVVPLRDMYFKDLSDEYKKLFWDYTFAVEHIPSTDEPIIANMFDRINRNVARLTSQELRHAKFSGVFISDAEILTEQMMATLPVNFPNLALQSRKQMKDVELTAQLLLLLEEGPKSYSQIGIDEAFSLRDDSWEARDDVVRRFGKTISVLSDIAKSGDDGADVVKSRLRNQADFYSLFGALDEGSRSGALPAGSTIASRLSKFIAIVDDVASRAENDAAERYFNAARSASNDAGPRRTRIDILKEVVAGRRPAGIKK
jgi:hypothetical protein